MLSRYSIHQIVQIFLFFFLHSPKFCPLLSSRKLFFCFPLIRTNDWEKRTSESALWLDHRRIGHEETRAQGTLFTFRVFANSRDRRGTSRAPIYLLRIQMSIYISSVRVDATVLAFATFLFRHHKWKHTCEQTRGAPFDFHWLIHAFVILKCHFPNNRIFLHLYSLFPLLPRQISSE